LREGQKTKERKQNSEKQTQERRGGKARSDEQGSGGNNWSGEKGSEREKIGQAKKRTRSTRGGGKKVDKLSVSHNARALTPSACKWLLFIPSLALQCGHAKTNSNSYRLS